MLENPHQSDLAQHRIYHQPLCYHSIGWVFPSPQELVDIFQVKYLHQYISILGIKFYYSSRLHSNAMELVKIQRPVQFLPLQQHEHPNRWRHELITEAAAAPGTCSQRGLESWPHTSISVDDTVPIVLPFKKLLSVFV